MLMSTGCIILDDRERKEYEKSRDGKKPKADSTKIVRPKKSFKQMTSSEYERYMKSSQV